MTTLDIPGSPGGLEALAGQLENAANDINAVRDRVATNGLDGEWSGQAADAFRSTLHRLPSELATVSGAFGDAMGTIRNFAGRLAELQQQAQWYDEKLEESERDLRQANERHDEAIADLRSANRVQAAAADPVSLHAAKQVVERGESTVRQAIADVEDIGGKVSQLNSGADSIRREYEEVVRSCCSALEAASPPGESMWSGLRHGFDDMTGGAILLGGAVWRGTDRGLHDAEKDVKDVVHFTVHEFDEHWSDIRIGLEVVGYALAAAAVIAILAGVTVTTGGVDIPFLIGALSVADAGAIFEGDDFEAQTGDASERKQYGRDLPGDAFNVVVSGLGVFARMPEDASKTLQLGLTVTDDALNEFDAYGIDRLSGELSQENQLIGPELLEPTRFLMDVPPAELMV
jgi:uncharacterized protein YukE